MKKTLTRFSNSIGRGKLKKKQITKTIPMQKLQATAWWVILSKAHALQFTENQDMFEKKCSPNSHHCFLFLSSEKASKTSCMWQDSVKPLTIKALFFLCYICSTCTPKHLLRQAWFDGSYVSGQYLMPKTPYISANVSPTFCYLVLFLIPLGADESGL